MQTNAASQIASPTMPELGHLKAATERVSAIANEIESFHFRFMGPTGGATGADVPQQPDTYRNDINQLFEQIARLEAVAAALRNIG